MIVAAVSLSSSHPEQHASQSQDTCESIYVGCNQTSKRTEWCGNKNDEKPKMVLNIYYLSIMQLTCETSAHFESHKTSDANDMMIIEWKYVKCSIRGWQ